MSFINLANLIVIIKEKEHELYKRRNEDLFITYTISLKDAINGKNIEIATLDNRKLNVLLDELVR